MRTVRGAVSEAHLFSVHSCTGFVIRSATSLVGFPSEELVPLAI